MIEYDGYAVREAVFSEVECEMLLTELAENLDLDRAGVRNLMGLEIVEHIANDARLLSLTQELTGTQLIPFKAILFNKTGKANWLVAWHQDTALPIECDVAADGWGPSSIKDGVVFAHAPTEVLDKILALRIHLDPSTPANGPLRVIPGSHRHRVSDETEFRELVNSGPQTEVTVDRGGVIAMRPLLIHASSKCLSDEPRRVLHIEYAPSLRIAEGVELAKA
ncbi:MAG TPA: phytanoyl-CoA dioxygenase family protein [Pyrinomonadaceae bacterium]|nr:phytanoyl-CoA dioxygenase family protein [Pyrinomonadaceae bacterium]